MSPSRLYEPLWTEHDHCGRAVALTCGNDGFGWVHIKRKHAHVLYECYQADMKRAVRDPLFVHLENPREKRWIYYTCCSDSQYAEQALRVVVSRVRRRTKDHDVIWTAFPDPRVHKIGLHPSTPIEVDQRLSGSKSEPCGDPRAVTRSQRAQDRARRRGGFAIPDEQKRRLERFKAELLQTTPGQPTTIANCDD